MMLPVNITNMIGCKLPVIGAPMFLVSYSDLVVAVSEAGGAGTFPSMNFRSLSELRDAITEIQSRTSKPFGVNIILHREHNPDWKGQLDICLLKKVKFIITSLGVPRTIIKEVKAAGSNIFCDVTNMRMAETVCHAGADALIAVSSGAGGHAGNISPFALIPYLSQLGVPVIAAGGIVNGKQMAAAFCLGASAVYVGTRLLASKESAASNHYKESILNAVPEDIRYSPEVSGIPANWIETSLEEYLSHTDKKKKWKDVYSAGHGVYDIKEILPAGEIVKNMAEECRTIFANFKESL